MNNTKTSNLLGFKFGRLLVLSEQGVDASSQRLFLCQCDCGTQKVIRGKSLYSGATKSCGCLQKELVIANKTTHGQGKIGQRTKAYNSWYSMKSRCDNPSNDRFNNYGGRGIKYDPRWAEYENFLADMGDCPEGCTLDRMQVNGNYEKDNCRWATPKEQANNTTANRILYLNGTKRTLTQWAEHLGISVGTIYYRLSKDWPLERVLTSINRGT